MAKAYFGIPVTSALVERVRFHGFSLGTNFRIIILLNFFSLFDILLRPWSQVLTYQYFFILRLFSFVFA